MHSFYFEKVNLEDLVSNSEIQKWFSSLKALHMTKCPMKSEHLQSLVDAIMEVPITELALKTLNLSGNYGLSNAAVAALASLAGSGKLPHLEILDLTLGRFNWYGGMITSIQTLLGSLPSLQIIQFGDSWVSDKAAKAIVEAYSLNKNLTANILMKWSEVKDPSLRTKLETYRERNVRLTKLMEGIGVKKPGSEKNPGVEKPVERNPGDEKPVEQNPGVEKPGEQMLGEQNFGVEKLGEKKPGVEEPGEKKPGVEALGEEKKGADPADQMTLTSARVFICGYGEVGKTTLRETLLLEVCSEAEKSPEKRSSELERSPEVNKGPELSKSPGVRESPQVENSPEAKKSPEVGKCSELGKSPEVGKTSLKKSLSRCFGKWCCCLHRPHPNVEPKCLNEKPIVPHEEGSLQTENHGCSLANQELTVPNEECTDPSNEKPRTRGIEISRIEEKENGKDTTLVLWDLAGQQDYHILHSAFLAGSESGKATIFILVFKLFLKFDPTVTRVAKTNLMYWLRMVAYGSPEGVKRHVFFVLNQFDGGKVPANSQKKFWEQLIGDCTGSFGQLTIHAEPFIIDVRDPAAVKPLKQELFQKARKLLQDITDVPRIVFDLQTELKEWSQIEENKGLPILTLEAFQQSKWNGNRWTLGTLHRAASYLHEIGEIIYLEKTDPKGAKTLTGPVDLKRSIVVPNPEWFCKNIVGELLLPQEAKLEGENWIRDLIESDGSISIPHFELSFKDVLVRGTESEDVISMLEKVGLCYRRGKDEIVIPSLIKGDNYDSIKWAGKENEVIGRCLTTKDQEQNEARKEEAPDHEDEGRKYFIPEALFRRLQVQLAHDPNFGGRGDTEYKVGKSFVSFNIGPFLVLVQYDVDESSPVDDRIDILVEIRKNSSELKLKAVECVCEIMQKLISLCVDVCPGLSYHIKVIEPASASKNVDKMTDRKLMSLDEIKGRIIRGEEELNWKTVSGSYVQSVTCLSQSELSEVVDTLKGQLSSDVSTIMRKYDECQKDLKAMGIRTVEARDEGSSSSRSTEDKRSKIPTSGSNDQEGNDEAFKVFLRKLEDRVIGSIEKLGDRLEGHMDMKFAELDSQLSEFRQKHDRLLKEVQAQRALFIDEKTSSVPRFIYLTKKQTEKQQWSSWISIKEVLSIDYELHFLCERHHKNGHVHEVEGQGGIELSKPQTWWVQAAPWLRRSLQVAVIVGKDVGSVFLPGIFSLIPDFTIFDSDLLAKAVDRAATDFGAQGIVAEAVDLEEKPIAKAVWKDLSAELSNTEVATKIGLVRRTFPVESYEIASSQRQVFWICNECDKGYGTRVKGI